MSVPSTPIYERKNLGKSTWRNTEPIANGVSNLRRFTANAPRPTHPPFTVQTPKPRAVKRSGPEAQAKIVGDYRDRTRRRHWLIGSARLGTTAHTRTDISYLPRSTFACVCACMKPPSIGICRCVSVGIDLICDACLGDRSIAVRRCRFKFGTWYLNLVCIRWPLPWRNAVWLDES